VDSDNVVRFVIAHDDPGVHNWLDTQGFSDGNLGYRNLMSQNPAQFRTRLVERADVVAQLPKDTAMVTAAERVEELRDRYHSIKLRFGI
jgi:LPS sulfotransferase NodH